MAELADKHQLYMQAVQNPKKEVKNIEVIYRTLSNRLLHHINSTLMYKYRYAVTLREDFCGTAILCAEWVRSSSLSDRRAYGVDIDPNVIEYANSHVISNLSNGSLIQLVCGDVLEAGCHSKNTLPPVDIIVAFNFSVCYFHQRRDLISYLKHSYDNLNEFGLLFCDIFGGAESGSKEVSRVRDLGSFRYLFRQHSFDLETNTVRFSLSFKMKDGSMLKDCFTYKFRIYSLCEIREAMLEAGFDKVSIWIATKDNDNSDSEGSDSEGSSSEDSDSEDNKKENSKEFGGFTEITSSMEMPYSFNAYVVGIKLPYSK
ncbi:hypothetical protein IWW36_004983 [Coemansia brasiliensis]|uniref:Uncharacterized protein n=1 Tax=Coemansia brasiliensis TaxID=2650707 RepID=A0A9W8LX39_9FUNG|nr:hypothetical protein IWW36_004983 [Coemansia brasiliensis]